MSDKEKLQVIKDKLDLFNVVYLDAHGDIRAEDDFRWLISQAEKMERYENVLNHWNTYFDFSQPVPKDLNELGTQKGIQRCFDIAKQALEQSS